MLKNTSSVVDVPSMIMETVIGRNTASTVREIIVPSIGNVPCIRKKKKL